MRKNLHMVVLAVEDLKKSLAFYSDGLGWDKSPHSQDEIAFFCLNGGMVFSLYPKANLARDLGLPVDEIGGTGGMTLAYNTRSEAEVDEVLDKAVKLGGKLVKPGQKAFWGGYSGYFKDLDGHLFEVAYDPHVNFDERDNLIFKGYG